MSDDDRAARIAEPYICVRCEFPITDEMMRGMGDGSDQRFAHNDCYWQSEAERLTAERDAVREALGCADDETTLDAVQELQMERQHYVRVANVANEETIPRLTAERDAALAREAVLAEALDNTTRELQMWHDTRPDPPGPLRDFCVSCGYLADARALLADSSRPDQEG